MRLVKTHAFEEITAYELGWSAIGPPMMTTHCYIFGGVMVDTGQSHMRKESLEIAETHRIRTIYLTHYHEDHSGNAGPIKKRLQAQVYGHPKTIEKMAVPFKILPYQKYMWGRAEPLALTAVPEIIQTDLGEMIPVHTPGHSKDHTSYFIKDKGVLLSGDLYLGDRIKYFRADENVGSQIESLEKVLALDFEMLLCSHAPRIKNGRKHIKRKLEFLKDFYGRIIQEREKGYGPKQIFSKLAFRESYFIKYFCFGDVSMMNGVRSAIRHNDEKVR